MFYVLIFSIAAVVLVAGGLTTWQRRKREYERDEVEHSTQAPHATHAHSDAERHVRKAKRAQSRHDRRKR